MIDRVAGSDVYPTFGDDSSAIEDARNRPRGKVHLCVKNRRLHAMWGDYKLAQDVSRFVRSDRTLYGISAGHKSAAVTANGDAKFAVEVYAASPDRAAQRDVLRGTGGTAHY
ncbi:MAG: hypothetical protein U5N55_13885 [Cypionkella sp.]|nr:hypothetical protein [Cypionkella sp.]